MNPASSFRLFITSTILFLFSISSLLFWPQVTSSQSLQSDGPASKFEGGSRTKTTAVRSENPQLIGSNGDYTVTSSDTVLNEYAVLAADALAGTSTIIVTDITDLDSPIPELGPIGTGDLLMIIQMQGATIDTSNTVSYGSVTALNGAGLYEIVYVTSISGNVITINNSSCLSGLRNSYSVAGRTQVVRVPQFINLTVNSGASIVPESWNGATGGVAALRVYGTLLIDGSIDGSGRGFRGGIYRSDFWSGETSYRTTFSFASAAKGEGIAGFGPEYDLLFGRYGRGAPANGGGGGNSHNGGGGGGANGNNGNGWTGQGVMVGGSELAWSLDPGYIANGNARTDSSGGGRGGYTLSLIDLDAEVVGPNNPAWGTPLDERREVGGLGGRPVDNDPAARLFLGGGGGAGEANNGTGGDGGAGGGLVFLIAGTLTGSGSVRSNGLAGADSLSPGVDAGSGGGAGGTVVIHNANSTIVPIEANGGRGGNQNIVSANEAAGPGGGGGGGFIAVRTGVPMRLTDGGTSGTTTSAALSEFSANGATTGAGGQNAATVPSIPFCFAPTAASVTLTGRATAEDGIGILGARIVVTRQDGSEVSLLTNPFGYFELDGIDAGETLVVSIEHKRYIFFDPVRVVTPIDSASEIEFIAVE